MNVSADFYVFCREISGHCGFAIRLMQCGSYGFRFDSSMRVCGVLCRGLLWSMFCGVEVRFGRYFVEGFNVLDDEKLNSVCWESSSTVIEREGTRNENLHVWNVDCFEFFFRWTLIKSVFSVFWRKYNKLLFSSRSWGSQEVPI